MFTNKDIYVTDFPYTPTQILRSILCFHDLRSLSAVIAKCFRSFALLRVLDLQNSELQHLPRGMELLVNLRYLAIWTSSTGFASSICNLWNLKRSFTLQVMFQILCLFFYLVTYQI
ncbi:putative leucine-rich repeat domain superfamily [Helianthus anomalus]